MLGHTLGRNDCATGAILIGYSVGRGGDDRVGDDVGDCDGAVVGDVVHADIEPIPRVVTVDKQDA